MISRELQKKKEKKKHRGNAKQQDYSEATNQHFFYSFLALFFTTFIVEIPALLDATSTTGQTFFFGNFLSFRY